MRRGSEDARERQERRPLPRLREGTLVTDACDIRPDTPTRSYCEAHGVHLSVRATVCGMAGKPDYPVQLMLRRAGHARMPVVREASCCGQRMVYPDGTPAAHCGCCGRYWLMQEVPDPFVTPRSNESKPCVVCEFHDSRGLDEKGRCPSCAQPPVRRPPMKAVR